MQINILIVDDVEANLISLEALLETIDEEYNIIKADGGNKALEITLNQPIDLIILDIQMPDIDGFEVAQLLKFNKKTKDIPIIFLTAAFKSDEWVQKGFDCGAVDYLTKPIDENQFLNRISLYTKLIKMVFLNKEKDKLVYEQSKMVSMNEMIGNIAHHWRQPLSVISTAASAMKFNKELGIENESFDLDSLDSINNSAQYLSKTIDDFRDFIEADASIIDFSLSKFLAKVLIVEDSMIKQNTISVITNIEEDIVISNRQGQFFQVFEKILINAKDNFISNSNIKERFIFISISKNQGKVVISIKDNGGGIPKNILPKIFDAYFTTRHKSQGKGLGLYTAYNIVTQIMKGTIEAKNSVFTHLDVQYTGAEFILTFPLRKF